MTPEPYTLIGPDPDNASTHVLIEVRGVSYSVFLGAEQQTAAEIAANLDS